MPGVRKAARNSARNPALARPVTGATFGRERRLTDASQFSRVFSGADRSADRYFTVLALANAERGARLGLTMSKRAAKRAVDRNRLKRLSRETFRHHALPALDIVVIGRPPARTADNESLRASLQRHFERLAKRRSAAHTRS